RGISGSETQLALKESKRWHLLSLQTILSYIDVASRATKIHYMPSRSVNSTGTVFQNCNLVLRKPHTSSAYNVILANGRSGPGQNTGFAIQNCKITTATDFSPVKHSYNSYLGRPWKENSRSVVMQTTTDEAIAPRGWVEWPGAGCSILRTLYFAEYCNVRPGAATANRVQ
ncbi:unnamed protein product, partial [Ilex paraguariensis]